MDAHVSERDKRPMSQPAKPTPTDHSQRVDRRLPVNGVRRVHRQEGRPVIPRDRRRVLERQRPVHHHRIITALLPAFPRRLVAIAAATAAATHLASVVAALAGVALALAAAVSAAALGPSAPPRRRLRLRLLGVGGQPALEAVAVAPVWVRMGQLRRVRCVRSEQGTMRCARF